MPVDQLVNVRVVPDVAIKDVERANVDVRHFFAWCDLSGQPVMLSSPTSMVWIPGRTQTIGPKDCAAVRAVQDDCGPRGAGSA